MSTIKMITHAALLVTASLWLTISTGCNVDPVWPDRQSPAGPTIGESSGAHPGDVAGAIDLATVEDREIDLVESVVAFRQRYHESLQQLREYYKVQGYSTKQSWADFELEGLHTVKPFRYLLDAEVPSAKLAPTDSIAEADMLFERSMRLMREGGRNVPVVYRRKRMVEAANVLRSIIEQHPTSDKIAEAAFFLGEIHNDYLPDQETIAVKWYERAWTWDPNTHHPAQLHAAKTYDYRLHDRVLALELYRSIVNNQIGRQNDIAFAQRRIRRLSATASVDGGSH